MRLNRKEAIVIGTGLALCFLVLGVFLTMGLRINTRTIPKGDISLSTPYTKYLVGEEIKFTIKNNFNSTIFIAYNCPAEPLDVFRLEGTEWKRVHATASKEDCDNTERTVAIPANGTKEASFAKWPKLFEQPGKYRIVAYVDYYQQLPFADFEVIDKPKVPEVPPITASPSTINQSATVPSATTSTTSGNNSTAVPTSNPSTPTTPSSGRKSKTISIAEGSVNVEYDSTTIYVLSVRPASGYSYEGGKSGRTVEITFKGRGDEIKLELAISNGQVVFRTERD